MRNITRRNFIAASAAAVTLPSIASVRASSANDELRVAVVGLGTRGKGLIQQFREVDGTRVAALCDPDQKVLDEQTRRVKEFQPDVVSHTDVRRVIDDKNIDAIAIATPNHWHSLLGIWACQAGKDVYVEKPVSHNLFEGWQLLAAAREHDRIVQTGTQNRSDVGLRPAAEFIHAGKIGPIKVVRGFCYNRRPSTGEVTSPQQVPDSIDYDLWSGPAPLKPMMRKQFHYDWHWNYLYGNGDVGNQGIHELDVCRWMLGVSDLPERVISAGGRFGYDDNANTPNTLITVLDYKPAPIVFEVRGLPAHTGTESMDDYRGQRVGIVVECENGYFAGGRGGGNIYDNAGKQIERFPGDSGATHVANFVDAVRTRDRSQLRAEIHEGVVSSGLSHFCNLSYQVGQATPTEDVRQRLASDPLANEAFGRMVEHLAKNDVDLERLPVTLGTMLTWDQGSKSFSDSRAANGLLSREYREPFVVPSLAS